MDISKIALGLVSLVIAVVVIALVAVPIIEDSTTGTPYSGENNVESYAKYIGIDETPTWSATISATTLTAVVGGETYTYTYSGNQDILFCDGFIVRTLADSKIFMWDFPSGAVHTFVVSDHNATVAMTAGSWTFTGYGINDVESTYTGTGATMSMIRSNDGGWILKYGQDPGAKATLGQTVYAGNVRYNNNATNYGPYRLDAFTDGEKTATILTPWTMSGNQIVAATATTTADYEQVGDPQAVGAYYGFDWTSGGSSGDYADFFVPIAFKSTGTAEGSTNTVLLMLIPVLLLMVAIMVAVRLVREA